MVASKLGITAPILQVMRDWGGKAEPTVLGTSLQLPAPNAALLTAMNVHVLDFDDTHFRIIQASRIQVHRLFRLFWLWAKHEVQRGSQIILVVV